MRTHRIHVLAGAALVASTACIVPPSMFERASWGPPPEYWQEKGRYAQSDERAAGTQGAQSARAAQAAQAAQDPSVAGGENAPPESSGAPAAAPNGAQPPLYAWDGGVVTGAPQGRVTEQEGTPRGLETPPAGRMHIIELYQQVLDERDALAREVEDLRHRLEETSLALDAKTKAADELTARVAALEEARTALANDNQTIAARLVQAQIRRLEAEKLLLETRIEAERAKAEEAARAAAAQTRPAKSKASAKSGEGERE